jgi:hypothetical protein
MRRVGVPSSLTLAHYRLALEPLETLYLPAFKGSVLRGGFGHVFKRLVCIQSKPCGDRCALGSACPYGYVFETSPPKDSEVLSTHEAVPRPFVIEPPPDRRREIPAGERLMFGLTLVGRCINYLPYFVAVFRELGDVGLGRSRGKYRLLAVDAVPPYGGPKRPIYRAEEDVVRTADSTVGVAEILAQASTLPCDRVTVRFLTPARLKHAGRYAQDTVEFHVLVRALLRRVSSLAYFHCGGRWETDYRGWVERAQGVEAVDTHLSWMEWGRRSGRQKRRIEMGGVVGSVTYAGDLAPFRPLLALGMLVHVGKGAVFGNGQYVVSDQ